MSYFPVVSSILSPEHLINFISDAYQLEDILKCSVLKTGINHNYLVETEEDKYVFRIYFHNWRTTSEILEELKLLNYLKNSISVSYPIKGLNGEYLQYLKAIEGDRIAVLFSYAEGAFIRNPSADLCYELGKTIANMHVKTENYHTNRTHYNANTLVDWATLKVKSHFLEVATEELQYFERANKKIRLTFSKVDVNKLRKGTIHLDLWYQNMKVKKDNEFTFFDFDNCGNGWLLLDIAYSIMLLFKNEPDKIEFEAKQTSFYKGYESIIKISDEEKELIPYGGLAIWLFYTGVHVERYNDFSNHFLSEEFLKFWISIVDKWMVYNEIEI